MVLKKGHEPVAFFFYAYHNRITIDTYDTLHRCSQWRGGFGGVA